MHSANLSSLKSKHNTIECVRGQVSHCPALVSGTRLPSFSVYNFLDRIGMVNGGGEEGNAAETWRWMTGSSGAHGVGDGDFGTHEVRE